MTDDQLDILRDKILLLGGATEDAVRRGVDALVNRDGELASAVLKNDTVIDMMELEIDRMSIDILGTLQPTAHDLRFVISVAKITTILERIADHAGSIAEAALILNTQPQTPNYAEFSLMSHTAGEMLREALDAFTNEDAARSRDIIERDKIIDNAYGSVFSKLLDLMVSDGGLAAGAAHLLFVAKHLERIGDYVKDICELNVYLSEAVFIKHNFSLSSGEGQSCEN